MEKGGIPVNSGGSYTDAVRDAAARALWEVENVLFCVPDELWNRAYCEMPIWKHAYHMLHSLDQWYINPMRYTQPPFHEKDLHNLDAPSGRQLSRADVIRYLHGVKAKINAYNATLTDAMLLEAPPDCEWTRFTLILSQFRHLHSHMGMLMGFIIADTGQWPGVLGLTRPIPDGEFGTFF